MLWNYRTSSHISVIDLFSMSWYSFPPLSVPLLSPQLWRLSVKRKSLVFEFRHSFTKYFPDTITFSKGMPPFAGFYLKNYFYYFLRYHQKRYHLWPINHNSLNCFKSKGNTFVLIFKLNLFSMSLQMSHFRSHLRIIWETLCLHWTLELDSPVIKGDHDQIASYAEILTIKVLEVLPSNYFNKIWNSLHFIEMSHKSKVTNNSIKADGGVCGVGGRAAGGSPF